MLFSLPQQSLLAAFFSSSQVLLLVLIELLSELNKVMDGDVKADELSNVDWSCLCGQQMAFKFILFRIPLVFSVFDSRCVCLCVFVCV